MSHRKDGAGAWGPWAVGRTGQVPGGVISCREDAHGTVRNSGGQQAPPVMDPRSAGMGSAWRKSSSRRVTQAQEGFNRTCALWARAAAELGGVVARGASSACLPTAVYGPGLLHVPLT